MGCSTKKDCLVLSASVLRQYITIETPTEAADSYGGFSTTWATFASAWVAINPVKNWEHPISMQNETRTTHKISMRYIAGLNDKMRIKFGTRYFNIRSIINREEANVTLDIMADEGLAT